jgi:hypothetical protein
MVIVTETHTQAYTYDQVTVTQYFTYPQSTVTQTAAAVTLTKTLQGSQAAVTVTLTKELPAQPAITVTITETARGGYPPATYSPAPLPPPPPPAAYTPAPPPAPLATYPPASPPSQQLAPPRVSPGFGSQAPNAPANAPVPVPAFASASSTWYCRTRCDGSWGPGRTPAGGAIVANQQQQIQQIPPLPTAAFDGRPYQGPQGYTPYGNEAWRGVNENDAATVDDKARGVAGVTTTPAAVIPIANSPTKSRQRVPTMTRLNPRPQEEGPKSGSGPAATPPVAGTQGAQPGDAVASTQASIAIETLAPEPLETVIIDSPNAVETDNVVASGTPAPAPAPIETPQDPVASPQEPPPGTIIVPLVDSSAGNFGELSKSVLDSASEEQHGSQQRQRRSPQLGDPTFGSPPGQQQPQPALNPPPDSQPQISLDPNLPAFEATAQPAPFQQEIDDACADGLDGRQPASGMCRARQKEEEAKRQQELAREQAAQQQAAQQAAQQQQQLQQQQAAQQAAQQACATTWYNPFSWLNSSSSSCQQPQQQQEEQNSWFKKRMEEGKPVWRGVGRVGGLNKNTW